MANVIDGDMVVSGNLKAGSMSLPVNAVGSDTVDSTRPLASSKTEHQHAKSRAQKFADTATAERIVIHTAYDAGTVRSIKVGATTANIGDSTVTFTLLKNGTNILSTTLQLTSANAAFALVVGTFLGTNVYVTGDVFELNVAVAAGTGTLAKGIFAEVIFREAAGA